MLLWLIGIACVKGMRSPWIIFFFIVRLLAPYGMLSLVSFGLSWVLPSRVVDLFAC